MRVSATGQRVKLAKVRRPAADIAISLSAIFWSSNTHVTHNVLVNGGGRGGVFRGCEVDNQRRRSACSHLGWNPTSSSEDSGSGGAKMLNPIKKMVNHHSDTLREKIDLPEIPLSRAPASGSTPGSRMVCHPGVTIPAPGPARSYFKLQESDSRVWVSSSFEVPE